MPRTAPFLARAAASLCLLACISMAHADVFGENDRVMVEVGPYVYHFHDNTDHNQWPRLIGVEYETGSHWLGALAKPLRVSLKEEPVGLRSAWKTLIA